MGPAMVTTNITSQMTNMTHTSRRRYETQPGSNTGISVVPKKSFCRPQLVLKGQLELARLIWSPHQPQLQLTGKCVCAQYLSLLVLLMLLLPLCACLLQSKYGFAKKGDVSTPKLQPPVCPCTKTAAASAIKMNMGNMCSLHVPLCVAHPGC